MDEQMVERMLEKSNKELKEKISRRQEFNRKIVWTLWEIVEDFPDWRFGQILSNVGIAEYGRDVFYDESADTYAKMAQTMNHLYREEKEGNNG